MTEPRRPRASTAAIVLNWNGSDLTRQCVIDLLSSDRPVDVIVIDNGSTDGNIDRLRALAADDVDVVLLRRNRGFAGGMNAGVARATAAGYTHVWLLNNDVSIPPDAHRRLASTLDAHPRDTILTPVLHGPNGDEQHVGGSYAGDGSANRLLTAPAFAAADERHTWLTGTALFCRASTAARVGPFDTAFFAYWEDVEWSFRARRLGVRLAVADDAVVTHHASQGAGAFGSLLTAFLHARNEFLLLRRLEARGARRRAMMARVVARQLRLAMLLDRQRRGDTAPALLGGVAAGLLGLSGRPRALRLPRALAALALVRPLSTARRLERWAGWPEQTEDGRRIDGPTAPATRVVDQSPAGSTNPPDGASD